MFEHIRIITLRAVFSAEKNGTLPPYLGSTIRGILGHCIRAFSCTNMEERCFRCDQKDTCLYVHCFSNTGKEAGAVNPYTLHVHNSGKTEWRKGDECTFDLTLIGDVISQAGLYLDAIQSMEHKGWGAARIPFKLERITDPGSETLIYAGGKTWLRNLVSSPLIVRERNVMAVLIEFDTPVRIVTGGELCEAPSFAQLIQFISRRISLLSKAFTDHLIEWDDEIMLEAARSVKTIGQNWRQVNFTRYSMTKSQNKLELPSIEGWGLYEGEISDFVPLLEAGRYLHVGKGVTIGFGHYTVTYDR